MSGRTWVTCALSMLALAAERTAHAGGPASDEPCPGPSLPSTLAPPTTQPWMNTALSPEERTELLLAQMTVEERVDLATGEPCGRYGFYAAGIPRLAIPPLTMADGPAGVRVNDRSVNQGQATALPAPLALAATWDVALARQHGDLLGREALATGHNVLLGPSVDLVRAPLWGRAFEVLGEDPLLAGQMGVAVTRGIQQHPVMASAKHYNIYHQETGRLVPFTLTIDERPLRELYTRPFEALVSEGAIASVMCAFGAVNGVSACEDQPLLRDVLKRDLGFPGFVLSDYGATRSTIPSARAGLDMEQPGGTHFGPKLLAAVQAGMVSAAEIEDKARRILLPMFRLGLFDSAPQIAPLSVTEDGAQARTIAEQAIVLLKNEGGLLPIPEGAFSSIAVIGADAAALAQGGGSAEVQPTYAVTPLDGLRMRAGAGVNVKHAEGTDPVTPAHLLPGPIPVPSSVLAPAGGEPGEHGLHAEYWLNPQFQGQPEVVRVDRQIAVAMGFFNFPGFNASSQPGLPFPFATMPFSARWTGAVNPPVTGNYVFTLTSRGRGWVYLDDQLIIDHSTPHDLAARSVTVPMTAGEVRQLRVDFASDPNATAGSIDEGASVRFGWEPPAGTLSPAVRRAAALAGQSDLAVVFVRTYDSEGGDRPSLTLPNGQDELIAQVVAANPHTIVVLTTGGPVTMPWLGRVPAVVQAWFGGQEQGNAIARVLFGDVNPSGKLPITFPANESRTPTSGKERFPGTDDKVAYDEGVFIGYRWFDSNGVEPLFPFGHGLSYTQFRYENLSVEALTPSTGGQQPLARVHFTLTNVGDREGAEVAQVYVGELPGVQTPPRQLAGFAKVALAPGASQTVSVDLPARAFSSWSDSQHRWVVAEGRVPLSVGGSSRTAALTAEVQVEDPGTAGTGIAGGGGCDCRLGSASPARAIPMLATLAALLVVLRRRRARARRKLAAGQTSAWPVKRRASRPAPPRTR